MLYFSYSKEREKNKMTTFTLIILIALILSMVGKFAAAVERGCFKLAGLFAFEICAFAYLARILM